MHTTQHAVPIGTWVDEDTLTCPGCHHPIRTERPTDARGLAAVVGPEFSHQDGSELCTDRRGCPVPRHLSHGLRRDLRWLR